MLKQLEERISKSIRKDFEKISTDSRELYEKANIYNIVLLHEELVSLLEKFYNKCFNEINTEFDGINICCVSEIKKSKKQILDVLEKEYNECLAQFIIFNNENLQKFIH